MTKNSANSAVGDLNSNIDTNPTKQVNKRCKYDFVFNNYKEENLEDLKIVLNKLCKRYLWGEEVGESQTPHLQGFIDLKVKARMTELVKLIPFGLSYRECRNEEALIKYCQKDGCNIVSYGFPVQLKLISNLKPWQESVSKSLNLEPDDRTVNWIYDAEGNMGKTVFSKYLFSKTDAIICTGGGNKDIACLIALLKKEGRDLNKKTSFIFNFPRSTEGISYKAIESVKDGLMTSVKYESSTLVFNCPHVWIFSNELPDTSKLSMDRWKIWTIKNDDLIEYIES